MNPRPDISDHPARILIVDEECDNRQLLEVMLMPEGYLLLTAASGEEALAMVAQHAPDLILLDIMMPGMDGYAVTGQIKRNHATKNIPIIMVTALDDRNARMLGLSAGAEDFLTKPVDRAELCVRVRNLLRLKAYGTYYDTYSQALEGEVSSRTADLVDRERLYRSTFDAAPVGIVHVGLDGQWLRVNQRLSDLLGYSRGELQGTAGQAFMPPEDVAGEAELRRQMAAGTLDRHVADERRYRRRDGNFVWARVNMSVYRNAEGQPQHFILVIEDTTERRTLETQLRQAQKMEAMGHLAGGVAHDFNNLLTVIVGRAHMLRHHLAANPKLLRNVDLIQETAVRAAGLTQQLLAFSRQQVVQLKVVDLNAIVTRIERMLRRLLREDVELVTMLAPDVGRVKADAGQIEQVILNLVVNAGDAMREGGRLTLETGSVELGAAYARQHPGSHAGRHVMLTVTDTGVGMDAATQAQIFEPFFTTKELGKGTGLGLATVFSIVKQSGGSIFVDSKPGVGSAFKVYLPCVEDLVEVAAPDRLVEQPRGGSETILLVEDEASLRELARETLQLFGYTVLVATHGADALVMDERHEGALDLLLTDMIMPHLNGRDLADQLRRRHPGLRVLFMSGYPGTLLGHLGPLEPGTVLLEKPFTPDGLARKVRAVLDDAQDTTTPSFRSGGIDLAAVR